MKFRYILIIVAIVAFLAGVLMPVLSRVTLLDPRPKLPPREDNRVEHPKGFSIVIPKGWTHKIKTEPNATEDSILLKPEGAERARFSSVLEVILYEDSEVPDKRSKLDDYHKSKFLGFDAMICEGRAGLYHHWEAIFSYDDKWFRVILMLPHGKHGTRYEKVPDYWWPFINSFRVEQPVVSPADSSLRQPADKTSTGEKSK